MKRSIGRVDQSRDFFLTEHPGKVTHLLRIGRLGDAPATLQHVNVEEAQSDASRRMTVFGLNLNWVNRAA